MPCYLNFVRSAYALSLRELLERDGIKLNEYMEKMVDEVLGEHLEVWVGGFLVYASQSIDSIYKIVKEKLKLG